MTDTCALKPKSDESGMEMTHTEAMSKVKKALADIIQSDSLLCDLPPEITLDEINSQIALEYGQAMVVNVRRADTIVMPVVVTQTATVLDLKHAIKRHFLLKQTREGKQTHISWRYIWKRHWLYFDGQKLTDDNKKLKELSITLEFCELVNIHGTYNLDISLLHEFKCPTNN